MAKSKEAPLIRAMERCAMPLLRPEQAAEALSISVRHLLHLTTDGEIPFVNVGRGLRMIRRYDPADIQAFIESRKVTESPREAKGSARASKHQKFEQYAPLDFKALREEIRRKKKEERERLRSEHLKQK